MFVLVFGGLLATSHAYVWHRIVRAGRLRGPAAWITTGLIVTGWVVILSAMAIWRSVPFRDATPYIVGAFVWLGTFFYLLSFLLVADIGRILHWLISRVLGRGGSDRGAATPTLAMVDLGGGPVDARRGEPHTQVQTSNAESSSRRAAVPLGRREFLARAMASTSVVGAVGTAGLGVRSANLEVTTPEVPVRLARLPRTLDGFRIALIADTHIGPILDGRFMRRVVEKANGLRPDAVVIVGDMVDGSVAMLKDEIASLAELRSRCGTYFVTGNHEFYVGARPWMHHLPRLGVRVLSNELVAVGDERGGASFDLAGFNDIAAGRIDPSLAPDASALAAHVTPERELVVLSHQPRTVDAAAALHAGLQLSGHTHGGQIWPFGLAVLLAQPYVSGLHRHTAATQIYVSRGTGFWGPPMRVFAPAEITQIVLVAA